MNQIVYISPCDIGSINGLTDFSNSEALLKYLNPVDYHSILFSTLYQSGVDYFEVDISSLPPIIKENEFWSKRITGYDTKALDDSYLKATSVLEGKFYHEVDKTYNVQQYLAIVDYLSKLFYSLKTGTPYINPEFISAKDFDLLETRMDKALLTSIRNFGALISSEKINTVSPTYSILKKDAKRFEQICETNLFKNYSSALQELPYAEKIDKLKKDVSIKALKIFNKYGNDFSFRETAFSFIKFNKNIIDLFVSRIPSLVGEFVISSAEKLTKEKKKIYFHEVKDAKYSTLLCNRIDEIIEQEGFAKFSQIAKEIKNEHNL